MATFTATKVAGGTGNSVIYKLEAWDLKSTASVSAPIDSTGYDYAIVYAIDNTKTSASGTGKTVVRAISPDGDECAYYSYRSSGSPAGEEEVLLSVASTGVHLGATVLTLPSSFVLRQTAANGGTTFTADIYVELHRNN